VNASRVTWHTATVASTTPETPLARRIVLDAPTWPGNRAGAHLDVRLTAEDGYQATRSYSIASAGEGPRVVLAVDEVSTGEVSPFLVHDLRTGDRLELHGPLGAYFLWPPSDAEGAHATAAAAAAAAAAPVQLVAGGSGVVPLYAMATARAALGGGEFRLLYSVRRPADAFFAAELTALVTSGDLRLDWIHTREAPEGSPRPAGRVTSDELTALVLPPESGATVYVCGPTPFVEAVTATLLQLGHLAERIRTERFGG